MVIQILDDRHNERPGCYRAYIASKPDSTVVCPMIGYASPGGSHRTIKAAALEARRMHPNAPIYRNGKLITLE